MKRRNHYLTKICQIEILGFPLGFFFQSELKKGWGKFNYFFTFNDHPPGARDYSFHPNIRVVEDIVVPGLLKLNMTISQRGDIDIREPDGRLQLDLTIASPPFV